MKKILFLSLVIVAALFAGCKKKDPKVDPSVITSISLKPSELVLLEGDTSRLSLLWEPTTAAAPKDLKWESSDTTVVQLLDQNGTIVAQYSGEALVTVTSGELKASCKITVAMFEDIFALDWLYYFPSSKTLLSDSVYQMEGASGTIYNCKLYNITFFAPNTLDFSDGMGEGIGLICDASVLCIEGGEYDGEMWERRLELTTNEEDLTAKPYACLAGKFDPEIVGSVFQPYMEDETGTVSPDWNLYETGVTGAILTTVESGDEGVQWYLPYQGMLNDGVLFLDYDEDDNAFLSYDFTTSWFYGWYGLAVDFEAYAAGEWANVLVQPFETMFSDEYRYRHNAPAEIMGAPRRGMRAAKVANANQPKRLAGRIAERPVRAKFFKE